MTHFHFIAGLPRSGSTLLSAILRQNPRITTGVTSPVNNMVSAMLRAVSNDNEAAVFISDEQRERVLRGIFTEFYQGADIVFDTNRAWPSKLPLLVRLFPECRVICCVRDVALIVDSFERMFRNNPLALSKIVKYSPDTTVYSRVQILRAGGVVGFALDALRDGVYSEHSDRLLLVEYDALVNWPDVVLDAVYHWVDLPRFAHDFDNVEQIPGTEEADLRLGLPGLHKLRRKVGWVKKATVLPPDLLDSFPMPFWRTEDHAALVISCPEPKPALVATGA